MVDMMALLKAPAGEAKKPSALGVGIYKGVIKGREFGKNSKTNNEYVRFNLGLTEWPENFDDEDKVEFDKPIDLAKRSMKTDFYFTEAAMWRFDVFVKTCGIDHKGKSYEEVIEELLGMPVFVVVGHYKGKDGDVGNQVDKIWGELEG